MIKNIKFSGLEISEKQAPLVIPEIGINHSGNLETAFKIVDSAHRAGAKIIKHQTHIPEDEMSFHARKIIPGNSNRNIYDIISSCAISEEDEYKLLKYVRKKKLVFLSTPFSRKAVDRLIKFNVSAFKIGSGEFNKVMRSMALKKGYTINEYGIYKTKKEGKKQVKDKLIPTDNEEEIFDIVQMDYLEPQNRV